MMKKLFLRRLCIFSLLFVTVATIANAQIKFGIKVGGNLSNMAGFEKLYNGIEEGGQIKTELKVGYSVGASMVIPIKQLFLEADLEYSLMGMQAKAKEDVDNEDIEGEKLNVHFLKVPVQLGYKYNLNPDTGLIFGVGVYGGYAISVDDYLKEELDYKRMDFGLLGTIGVEFVNHRIAVSYEYGLVDLVGLDGWSDYKKANDLSAIRNTNFKLSYTYYF